MKQFLCPVPGCKVSRRAHQVCCRKHWYQVPKADRDAVWASYRRDRNSPEHAELVLAVINKLIFEEPEQR